MAHSSASVSSARFPVALRPRLHQVVVVANVDQQVLQHLGIDIDRQPNQRQFRAGEGFALERQRHRHQQVVARIVLEHLVAAIAHLMPLKDDHDPRLVHHRLARAVAIDIQDLYPWHR